MTVGDERWGEAGDDTRTPTRTWWAAGTPEDGEFGVAPVVGLPRLRQLRVETLRHTARAAARRVPPRVPPGEQLLGRPPLHLPGQGQRGGQLLVHVLDRWRVSALWRLRVVGRDVVEARTNFVKYRI